MILPQHVVSNPAALVHALVQHRVTHLTAVPTLLAALLPYLHTAAQDAAQQAFSDGFDDRIRASNASESRQQTDLNSCQKLSTSSQQPHKHAIDAVDLVRSCDNKLHLQLVISSGETLTNRLAQQLKQSLPEACKLLNVYGCTEVAADATCHEVLRAPQQAGISQLWRGSTDNATEDPEDEAAEDCIGQGDRHAGSPAAIPGKL